MTSSGTSRTWRTFYSGRSIGQSARQSDRPTDRPHSLHWPITSTHNTQWLMKDNLRRTNDNYNKMGGKKTFTNVINKLQTCSGWYSCFYTALRGTSTTHYFDTNTHLKWTITQHTTSFHGIKINNNHFQTQTNWVLQFRLSYCNYGVMTKYFKVLPVLSRMWLSKSMW